MLYPALRRPLLVLLPLILLFIIALASRLGHGCASRRLLLVLLSFPHNTRSDVILGNNETARTLQMQLIPTKHMYRFGAFWYAATYALQGHHMAIPSCTAALLQQRAIGEPP